MDGFQGRVAAPYASPDLEQEVRRLIDPKAATKSLHWGRNYLYTACFQTPQGKIDVVVKQFRNQSLKARLRRLGRGSKAERSFQAARALGEAGVRTPEPLLLVDSTRLEGPSYYVCRYLRDALEARYLLRAMNAGREAELFPEVDTAAFLRSLGRLLRQLHDSHLWYRDFTSGNVLLHRANGAGASTPELYLVDTNRARIGRRLSLNERIRDLCRMPIFRSEHQELFLESYWGGRVRGLKRALYRLYHHGFRLKNQSKQGFRGGLRRLQDLVLPRRRPHVHIEPAKSAASVRDKTVWDPLSDQPHQHAGRFEKLGVRLADTGNHLRGAAVVVGALPRIRRRYRELRSNLYREPVPWGEMGVCLRPRPRDGEALLAGLEDLGVRQVMLRLHPWEGNFSAEEALARELCQAGFEVAYALPQNRDLVRDPSRWQAAVEEIAERFTPYGRHFQIGQAINRSKWGVWNHREYVDLVAKAEEVLRRRDGVEVLGPAVIDFEPYTTALVLNLPEEIRFDVVTSLLYVDRRGAPENRQLGFDTVDKVVLLKALADTARNASPRCWITEVNWPLWEGPHSPAGRDVAVDEETQADYLVRYYLLALGTGLVERVYWWRLIAKGYGLVDPGEEAQLRRRPSYRAWANLSTQLEGSVFLGPVSSAPGARLLHFRRPDGEEVVVGWCADGKATEVALPRPCRTALSRDGDHHEGAADQARVRLSSSPSYFVLARGGI